MPLKQKAKDSGVFRASELAMLGRVFDETTVADETEEERSARATRILDFFLAGIVDEVELRTLARPLGGQHPHERLGGQEEAAGQ